MKATELKFPLVQFVMPFKVVLTYESVDEMLECDIQMKPIEYWFPLVLFVMPFKVVLTFESSESS